MTGQQWLVLISSDRYGVDVRRPLQVGPPSVSCGALRAAGEEGSEGVS